jgi:hypothetical protein
MPRRIVRMLRPYASCNAGEVCGFDIFEATALVLRGLAAWSTPEQGHGAPTGPLPPLRQVQVAGQLVDLAPNIPVDAAFLRARAKKE